MVCLNTIKLKNRFLNLSTFYQLGKVLYFVAFIGSVCSPALTYWGYLQLSRRLFIISMGITFPALVCMFLSRKIISFVIKKQFFICYLIIGLIFFPMFIRNIINGYPHYYFFPWFECICICIGLLFWCQDLFINRSIIIKIFKWLNENRFLIFLCCIITIIAFEQLPKMLRWDSISYYAYIERLKDFTFNPNDIILFKSSGHANYGYMLLYSIGESLCPSLGYGVNIETVFFFILAILFLDKDLKLIMPNGEKKYRLFTIMLFSVTPIILGPIHNIDAEVLILSLFIILFYCYINKLYILTCFLGTFFVFTKETCVFILAFLLIGDILTIELKEKRIGVLFSKPHLVRFMSLYIPLCIFLIYFCFGTVWGNASRRANSDLFNTWGINSTVIISKLKQLLIMNFTWPIIILFIFAVICFYKFKDERKKVKYSMQLFFAFISFLMIQLFYITYTFPRYLMLYYFYLAIVFQWSINQIHLKKAKKTIICTVLVSVTLIQNFCSLDIVSRKVFDTLEIGNLVMTVDSPIIYFNNTTVLTDKNADFLILSPYADMNRQWSYFDDLINIFLQHIKYTENILILYPDSFPPRSENIYFGMLKDNIYYDIETNRLIKLVNQSSLAENNMNLINYNAQLYQGDQDNFDNFEKIYYLEFPFTQTESKNVLSDFNIKNQIDLTHRGWSLKAYQIK